VRNLLLLILLVLSACKPVQNPPQNSSQTVSGLTLFATEEFRSSGLEATIVPDFEKEMKCKINIRLFSDPALMMRAFVEAGDSVDIVIGIPNGFVSPDSLQPYFRPYQPTAMADLNKDCIADSQFRIIPYGFSYLGLLYNKEVLGTPPASFGELQDERFLNQMALISPETSAAGRAMLHFSIALFGQEGFEQMLRALRKNVYREYPSVQQALAAVNSGESVMMPGPVTLAAWQRELSGSESKLEFAFFDEGAYQYSECMGIAQNSVNASLAESFIDFMLKPSSQKMVIYKKGLFPSNRKTILPNSFEKVPFSPWLVNSKMRANFSTEQSEIWLSTWAQVFQSF